MKVGFISTYPPIECGIATYSEYLIKELEKLVDNIYIVSEYGANGRNVYPVYNSQDPDLAHKIFSTMIKFHPDIVHIQHEFGLYGLHRGVNIIPLIYKFKLSRIPVVVTLHTIYDEFSFENKTIVEAILRISDGVIVHEDYQKESIFKNIGKFKNIHIIPHGVRQVEFIKDTKEKINLEGKKVILLMGFFRPGKNFEQIIRIFPQINKKTPESMLVVAGDARLGEHSDYMDMLVKLINESETRESIMFIRGKFSQEKYDEIVCCADVAPLPYKITAQSGVMAHFLAFGIPLVTSDLTVFTEKIKKFNFGFICRTDEEFVENIIKLLEDCNLRRKISSSIKEYVNNNLLWEIIAEKTFKLYKNIARMQSI